MNLWLDDALSFAAYAAMVALLWGGCAAAERLCCPPAPPYLCHVGQYNGVPAMLCLPGTPKETTP